MNKFNRKKLFKKTAEFAGAFLLINAIGFVTNNMKLTFEYLKLSLFTVSIIIILHVIVFIYKYVNNKQNK